MVAGEAEACVEDAIVIVGTGQSAFQLASSLRDEGYSGVIRLVGEESHLPYQRPPLSKSFLDGACETVDLILQDASWYASRGVVLDLGARIVSINRAARHIQKVDGSRVPYRRLVLATGARNRRLPVIQPGPGVHGLRGIDGAKELRDALGTCQAAAVIGGGFLGLEFAAAAAQRGVAVTVIEAAPALMARAVSPVVADLFRTHHEALGTRILLETMVERHDRSTAGRHRLHLSHCGVVEVDMVVVSAGVVPNDELAGASGLPIENGIIVDEFLRTIDPAIFALGDCASFPSRFTTMRCRIESVQNAIDQARSLAKTLCGRPANYDAVPWFWSDQGGLRLQIAGLATGADEFIVRGDFAEHRLSAYAFRSGRLSAVDSVGRPADHMTARRLLAAGVHVTPAHVADPLIDLKALIPAAAVTQSANRDGRQPQAA